LDSVGAYDDWWYIDPYRRSQLLFLRNRRSQLCGAHVSHLIQIFLRVRLDVDIGGFDIELGVDGIEGWNSTQGLDPAMELNAGGDSYRTWGRKGWGFLLVLLHVWSTLLARATEEDVATARRESTGLRALERDMEEEEEVVGREKKSRGVGRDLRGGEAGHRGSLGWRQHAESGRWRGAGLEEEENQGRQTRFVPIRRGKAGY
jgi:hypothetical protein